MTMLARCLSRLLAEAIIPVAFEFKARSFLELRAVRMLNVSSC